MKVCLVASSPIRHIPRANSLAVLRGWGQTWIWDVLKVTGGTGWVDQSISKNCLVAVTDRSYIYIKEHYPDLYSAALESTCTRQRPCG